MNIKFLIFRSILYDTCYVSFYYEWSVDGKAIYT